MTRAQAKSATAQAILTAARALFNAHGYEAVTVRQICTAAGKSTGALFNCWPDGKDELFVACTGRRPIRDRQAAALVKAALGVQVAPYPAHGSGFVIRVVSGWDELQAALEGAQ